MSRGGSTDRFLDSIPGYAGYRDRERRRDSDRVIRENIALEFGQQADRLGAYARRLADERKIMAVPVLDRPYQELKTFIDRVRTAAYGYAPLFSDSEVDAAALDQVALFDRSIATEKSAIESLVAAVINADTSSDDFDQAADALSTQIRDLNEKFDKRNEIIHAGKALPPADIVSYLEDRRSNETSPAFRLHERDALAYRGTNYTVVGRVSVETAAGAFRAFQLNGGAGDAWLVVPSDPSHPNYFMSRIDIKEKPGADALTVDGAGYSRNQTLQGKGEIIGVSGSAANQSVRFTSYSSDDGNSRLLTFDWDSGILALVGAEAEPAGLELFTREV